MQATNADGTMFPLQPEMGTFLPSETKSNEHSHLFKKLQNSLQTVDGCSSKTHEEYELELLSPFHHKVFVHHADKVPRKNKYLNITKQIIKILIGIIFLPLGIYWMIKWSVRFSLLPILAKEKQTKREIKNYFNRHERTIKFNQDATHPLNSVQRTTLFVKGQRINAYIVTDQKALKSHEWVLVAGRNYESATLLALGAARSNSETLQRSIALRNSINNHPNERNSSLLFFDYPGVMGSEGQASIPMMQTVYLEIFKSLQKEFQAKKIVSINSSMGGGVAIALAGALEKDPEFLADTKVVFIHVSTYSSLVKQIESLISRKLGGGIIAQKVGQFLGWLGKQWKWDANVAEGVTTLAKHNIPQLILYCNNDPTITPDASLAHAISKEETNLKKTTVLFLNEEKDLAPGNPHITHPIGNAMRKIVELTKQYMEE